AVYIADTVEDLGILASPNDEETTEQVVSVRKTEDPSADGIGAAGVSYINAENVITSPAAGENLEDTSADDGKTADTAEEIIEDVAEDTARAISQMVAENMTEDGATQLNQVYTHPLLNAWRAVYPVLIPYGTAILMVILVTAYYTWSTIHNQQPEDPVKIAAQVVKTSIFRLIPTSLIAGSAAFFLYRKDERRRKAGFLGKGPDFVWDPPVIWFSVIVLAVACSQLLNDIMNILKLQEIFPGYSNVTGVVTEEQPVWLVILTIGLLAPIMEELVFRGLIFRRLKDWMNPILAIVMSAVLFGIYHGNMVQFIYATLMGVMLAIIYHRTGTLWTAILAHVSANLWSVVGSTWWNSMTGKMTYGFFVGIIIELLLCVIPAYWIFAKNKK
ncbi:MAG: CPBP family intramembrane metalloprotease, partial [Clostridia bacterium]|nr:CPBP family intramembrane metalloprotease [Clostridia bacterium]